MTWLTFICATWLSAVGFFGPTSVMEIPVRTTAAKVGTLGLELESSRRGVGTLGLTLEDSPRSRPDRGIGTLRLELEDSPSQSSRQARPVYQLPTGTLYLDLE